MGLGTWLDSGTETLRFKTGVGVAHKVSQKEEEKTIQSGQKEGR